MKNLSLEGVGDEKETTQTGKDWKAGGPGGGRVKCLHIMKSRRNHTEDWTKKGDQRDPTGESQSLARGTKGRLSRTGGAHVRAESGELVGPTLKRIFCGGGGRPLRQRTVKKEGPAGCGREKRDHKKKGPSGGPYKKGVEKTHS